MVLVNCRDSVKSLYYNIETYKTCSVSLNIVKGSVSSYYIVDSNIIILCDSQACIEFQSCYALMSIKTTILYITSHVNMNGWDYACHKYEHSYMYMIGHEKPYKEESEDIPQLVV